MNKKLHKNEEIFNHNAIVSINKFFHKFDVVDPHCHSRAQLIYADKGLMEIYIDDTYWLMTPSKGMIIPANCDHKMIARTDVHLKTLYINTDDERFSLFDQVISLYVSNLLKELIIRATEITVNYKENSFEEKLLLFTINEIINCKREHYFLSLGKDPRIKLICECLIRNPKDTRSLVDWSIAVGASPRTIMRSFKKETGMNYLLWKDNIKVIHAIHLFFEKKSISFITDYLGFSSQSAFSVMFKRTTGFSPKKYLEKFL